MDKVSRSWRLLAASIRLVRANRSLLVFPAVAAAALVILMAVGVGGPILWYGEAQAHAFAHRHTVAFIVYALALTLPCSIITISCNAALIGCVLLQLEGKPHGWRDGLRMAWAKRKAIVGWALVCVIGWLVIAPLGRLATWIPGIGGHAGKLFFVVVCVSWALVTFLVMPVIVFEAQPNIWARLRRSEELLKRTWGEQVFGRLSVLVLLYAIMAVFVVPLLLASHAGWVSASVTHLLFIILLIVLNPLLGAIGAAIQSIYSAACYSYAVTGMLPQEFGPELLPQSKGD